MQSALLEVMQEHQVTIGGETFKVPRPFLVMATQNPIESEGTYPLPEAQVDRFLFKVVVDYPTLGEEAAVVGRSLGRAGRRARAALARRPRALRGAPRAASSSTATSSPTRSQLADATRNPARYGLEDLETLVEYGASPRGPISVIHAARALALLRGRGHVDRRRRARPRARRPAPPPRALLRRAVRGHHAPTTSSTASWPPSRSRRPTTCAAGGPRERAAELRVPDGRQGPGPMPNALVEALDLPIAHRAAGALPGDRRAAGVGAGTELAQLRAYQVGDDVRQIDAAATRAHRRAARARARAGAHADDVARDRRLAVDGVRHRRPAEVPTWRRAWRR